MKKLLFILALLCVFSANAQESTLGLTGKLGAFHTVTSSSQSATADIDYGLGLQLSWVCCCASLLPQTALCS
ncbi:hypothetical protein [Pontibacter rugosus]